MFIFGLSEHINSLSTVGSQSQRTGRGFPLFLPSLKITLEGELPVITSRFQAGLVVVVFSFLLPLLVMASPALGEVNLEIIKQIESNGNPKAVGKAGEIGLYQISPICLRHYNENHHGTWQTTYASRSLFNSNVNKRVAQWYFDWLQMEKGLTDRDAIIAYNFGYGNLMAGKELPQTTKDYLKKYKALGGKL